MTKLCSKIKQKIDWDFYTVRRVKHVENYEKKNKENISKLSYIVLCFSV